ncbi:UNVERIFIED_CONTAM: hypothetical protein Slati_2607600 [Sesamum latifolium]|uniref:J domain-containing protein n=1 Tax=Sesamum latifolium TaxID=2727402 RepID=A0AAW2VTX5_9LAMI
MSNLRAICRPHAVLSSTACCYRSVVKVYSVENPKSSVRPPSSSSVYAVWFGGLGEHGPGGRLNRQRRMVATRASNWTDFKSPYETLELERDADEEQIKVAYRRLAKFYHPDGVEGPSPAEQCRAWLSYMHSLSPLLIHFLFMRQDCMLNSLVPSLQSHGISIGWIRTIALSFKSIK